MSNVKPFPMRDSVREKYLHAGGQARERAAELAEGIERLLATFVRAEAVPLDVLERVERAIVLTHTANLLRLNGSAPVRRAIPRWATASLHDLSCPGPDGCVCAPVYVK